MNCVKNSLIVISVLSLGSCSYCANNIGPLNFKGVVKEKYLDSTYKNVPRIIVESKGEEIMFSPDGHDTTSLWMHLQVGDSLIKNKGTYDFKVIRNGEVKWYTLDCL